MPLFSYLKDKIHGFFCPQKPLTVSPCRLDRFFHMAIEDIMIPRSDMIAVSSQLSFEDLAQKFLKTGFQWLPVFRDTLDTIIGVVSVHCALSLQTSCQDDLKWHRHLNQGSFSPGSMTLKEAMGLFFQMPKHPVIFVVDEHGGVEGMLTKGHLLKELAVLCLEDVGEEEMIISRDPLWVINGRMDIDVFQEEFGPQYFLNEEHENRVNTIGGWICSYVGRVPLSGEMITHPSGFIFEIRQATPRKIHQIAILQFPASVNQVKLSS